MSRFLQEVEPVANQLTMTSILKTLGNTILGVSIAAIFIGMLASSAMAQSPSSQVITVSPSLFSVTVEPGQPWQSALRVINSNNYELVVYPSVMDFIPSGEGGTGQLMPRVDEEMAGQTLVDWIQVSSDPIRIPPQETASVPVTVIVPNDAIPCGHYAAIVVSSMPPQADGGAPSVQTTQMVTSLFFLTVDGECIEQGTIREFGSSAQIYGRPDVDFNLRFENRGTVHIQPQGEITITNMWGQERGTIPVNTKTSFGNVLPDSIRGFNFSWSGEFSIYDIGRYKAEVALVYGSEARQTVSASTYFWIIPLKEIALGAIVYLGLLLLIGWSIKLYIRRLLRQSMPVSQRPEAVVIAKNEPLVPEPPVTSSVTIFSQVTSYFKAHQLIITVVAFCVGVVMTWLFLSDALRTDTYYEVSIGGEVPVTLSAEDIAYQKLRSANPLETEPTATSAVLVTNASGQAGLGADARVVLEDAGYEVTMVTTDTENINARTVILFTASQANAASELSAVLGGLPVSVVSDEAAAGVPLQLRIGSDYSE